MVHDPETVGDVGWVVAQATIEEARRRFGARLRSAYVLGSLAHGGFAPLVSDVDVALVLTDSTGDDQTIVSRLTATIKASDMPLAKRVSVFWGTVAAIEDRGLDGRFPPLDRLDLIRHGKLISGAEIRGALREPSPDELVVGAARFAVDILGRPQRRRAIVDARHAAAAGPRTASKVALFPVRFLFTAWTGSIGENEAAAADYLSRAQTGARAELVRAALGWRTRWGAPERDTAVKLLSAAAVPLHQEFTAVYVDRLTAIGENVLADHLATWARSLRDSRSLGKLRCSFESRAEGD